MLILVNEAIAARTFAIVFVVNASSCALEQILGQRKYSTPLGFLAELCENLRSVRFVPLRFQWKKRKEKKKKKKKTRKEEYIAYFYDNFQTV